MGEPFPYGHRSSHHILNQSGQSCHLINSITENWLQYVWTAFDAPDALELKLSGCSSFASQCPVYAACDQVTQLYFSQPTITNFYTYLRCFHTAFIQAAGNISQSIRGINDGFPIQVPIVSEARS